MKLDFVFSFFSPLFDDFAMGRQVVQNQMVLFEASLTNAKESDKHLAFMLPSVKHEADFT